MWLRQRLPGQTQRLESSPWPVVVNYADLCTEFHRVSPDSTEKPCVRCSAAASQQEHSRLTGNRRPSCVEFCIVLVNYTLYIYIWLCHIYNVSFQYSLIILFLLRYFSVKNCEARGWLFTVDDFVVLQHRPVTVEHCFKLVAKDQRLLGLLCRISESTAADSRYVITAPGLDCNWFTHQHARTCLPSVCSGVSQRAAVDDVLWKYLSLDLCLNVYRISRIHAGVQRFHSIKTSPWWRAVSREQVCQQDSLWLLLFIEWELVLRPLFFQQYREPFTAGFKSQN